MSNNKADFDQGDERKEKKRDVNPKGSAADGKDPKKRRRSDRLNTDEPTSKKQKLGEDEEAKVTRRGPEPKNQKKCFKGHSISKKNLKWSETKIDKPNAREVLNDTFNPRSQMKFDATASNIAESIIENFDRTPNAVAHGPKAESGSYRGRVSVGAKAEATTGRALQSCL